MSLFSTRLIFFDILLVTVAGDGVQKLAPVNSLKQLSFSVGKVSDLDSMCLIFICNIIVHLPISSLL
jgi:hypothetical protein